MNKFGRFIYTFVRVYITEIILLVILTIVIIILAFQIGEENYIHKNTLTHRLDFDNHLVIKSISYKILYRVEEDDEFEIILEGSQNKRPIPINPNYGRNIFKTFDDDKGWFTDIRINEFKIPHFDSIFSNYIRSSFISTEINRAYHSYRGKGISYQKETINDSIFLENSDFLKINKNSSTKKDTLHFELLLNNKFSSFRLTQRFYGNFLKQSSGKLDFTFNIHHVADHKLVRSIMFVSDQEIIPIITYPEPDIVSHKRIVYNDESKIKYILNNELNFRGTPSYSTHNQVKLYRISLFLGLALSSGVTIIFNTLFNESKYRRFLQNLKKKK